MIYNFEVPRSDQTSESECDWSNPAISYLDMGCDNKVQKIIYYNIL